MTCSYVGGTSTPLGLSSNTKDISSNKIIDDLSPFHVWSDEYIKERININVKKNYIIK